MEHSFETLHLYLPIDNKFTDIVGPATPLDRPVARQQLTVVLLKGGVDLFPPAGHPLTLHSAATGQPLPKARLAQ